MALKKRLDNETLAKVLVYNISELKVDLDKFSKKQETELNNQIESINKHSKLINDNSKFIENQFNERIKESLNQLDNAIKLHNNQINQKIEKLENDLKKKNKDILYIVIAFLIVIIGVVINTISFSNTIKKLGQVKEHTIITNTQ